LPASQLLSRLEEATSAAPPRAYALRIFGVRREGGTNPDDRVFRKLRPGGADQKLGYYFTKWWSRYRKDIGVYEKRLEDHSFRASVTTKLAEAGVSLEVRNELLGHEGKSTDERNYQKGFSLKFLADAIGKVSWPEVRL
jgi:integrase